MNDAPPDSWIEPIPVTNEMREFAAWLAWLKEQRELSLSLFALSAPLIGMQDGSTKG